MERIVFHSDVKEEEVDEKNLEHQNLIVEDYLLIGNGI